MITWRRVGLFGAVFTLSACATVAGPQTGGSDGTRSTTPQWQRSDFMGANASTVEALLGAPSLSRREGEGEYRRYGLSTCTLVIILYPDEKGVPRVAHMDATAQGSAGEKPDLDACLAKG